ncbi:hypothetical protein [Streptomyces sp. NPDC050388]|uniref:hypothetical protein n=1 Tax=Streptomyces sp. NPDC050388 TaxID=3155781 RepID=UPI00342EECB9
MEQSPGPVSTARWRSQTFPHRPHRHEETEELLLQRGVIVSYETVRRWGATFARPTPTDCAAAGPAVN